LAQVNRHRSHTTSHAPHPKSKANQRIFLREIMQARRRIIRLAQQLCDADAGFYSLTDTDVDGKSFDFGQLKGKVVYAVNTASK